MARMKLAILIGLQLAVLVVSQKEAVVPVITGEEKPVHLCKRLPICDEPGCVIEQDHNNCPICVCKKEGAAEPCPMPMCSDFCPFGLKTNERGCITCQCKKSPCEDYECPEGLTCRANTENKKPECITVGKNEVSKSKVSQVECPALKCDPCTYGYKSGEDGCQTCECFSQPCESHDCGADHLECRPKTPFCEAAVCPMVPDCGLKSLCHRRCDELFRMGPPGNFPGRQGMGRPLPEGESHEGDSSEEYDYGPRKFSDEDMMGYMGRRGVMGPGYMGRGYMGRGYMGPMGYMGNRGRMGYMGGPGRMGYMGGFGYMGGMGGGRRMGYHMGGIGRVARAVSQWMDMPMMPDCDEFGHFVPRQCHPMIKECWCVDDRGVEVDGTRKAWTNEADKPDCVRNETKSVHGRFQMNHDIENVQDHIEDLKLVTQEQLSHWLYIEKEYIIQIEINPANNQVNILKVDFIIVTDANGEVDLATAMYHLNTQIQQQACNFDYLGHTLTPQPDSIHVQHHFEPQLPSHGGLLYHEDTYYGHKAAILAGLLGCMYLLLILNELIKLMVSKKHSDFKHQRMQTYKENLAFSNEIYGQLPGEKPRLEFVDVDEDAEKKIRLSDSTTA